MQLFFNPVINENTSQIIFEKEESGHIAKVLRKKEGQQVFITNGKGLFFTAEITLANPKNCVAKVIAIQTRPKHPYNLHLAVAPTKMNDRYEWFLEKATEIGVDEITPLICEHSERTTVKTERLEKIVQAAMKQSLQCHLPMVNPPVSFKNFIKLPHQGQKFIAHCTDTEKKLLQHHLVEHGKYTILIGPEGDFSSEEIGLALHQNFVPVSLGENRLRTETAAMVACHTVALCNSTLKK